MKLLSLFDGSGAFCLAAERHGIEARYASEIEPFPIAVTRARFPRMEHLGDIAKIDGGTIEPCELVTFGSPCTSWSISGKKLGLDGVSGLFFEAVRVMREMLAASGEAWPAAFIFENVPHLLHINNGADWKIVMDAFSDLGFICDPNILDSQEFGIAQRRKRIFIVGINRKHYNPGYFANIPNSRHKRMQKAIEAWGGETFHGITSRLHEIRRQHLSEILEQDVDPKYYLSAAACLGILRRVDAKGKEIPQLLRSALEYQAGLFPAYDAGGEVCSFEPGALARLPGHCWDGVSPTLRAGTHGGDNQPSVAYGISSLSSYAMNSANPRAGVYETDTAKTLNTSAQVPSNQGGLVVCTETYAMTTGSYAHAYKGQAPTLLSRDFKGQPVVARPPDYVARRLTPTECLALMNLPQTWCEGIAVENPTEEDYLFWEGVFNTLGKKKSRKQIARWLANPYSDSACFKMAGNGVVVAVAQWVLEGVVEYAQSLGL